MRLSVDAHVGDECMRLGNLVDRLQNAAAVDEGEHPPGPIGADGFDRNRGRRQRWSGFGPEPEARRNAVLEHVENDRAVPGLDPLRLIVVMCGLRRPMIVTMAMTMAGMRAAAQQPRAGEVDAKAKDGDRDRLGKADRRGRDETAHRFVADQKRDHRQDDGAGVAGKIAKFAGPESEARVVRVAPREGVGERRQQQCAGMGAHVQAVGDERDRAEQPAADDFGRHHGGAKPDHRPGPAFALFVAFAKEDVAVERRLGASGAFALTHGGPPVIRDGSGRRRQVVRPRASACPGWFGSSELYNIPHGGRTCLCDLDGIIPRPGWTLG